MALRLWTHLRCEGSEGSEGKVLKMDGPSAQGFLSLTGPSAPRVVVAASPRIIKSALRDWLSISYGMINILRLARCARLPLSGCTIGHTCGVRGDVASPRRFLRLLSLTAFQAEGGGIALSGDEYEVSVTGCPCCTIWHDKHSTVENHTTAPAERGRSVFPRVKARL